MIARKLFSGSSCRYVTLIWTYFTNLRETARYFVTEFTEKFTPEITTVIFEVGKIRSIYLQ